MNGAWFLKKWKGYVLCRDYLNENQQLNAAVFFNALKELNEDDIAFLYAKYYDTNHGLNGEVADGIYLSYRPHADKRMANKMGIDGYEYTKRRMGIEKKLLNQILKLREEVKNRSVDLEPVFLLKLGHLYLKEYQTTDDFIVKVKPDFVLTQDGSRAKRFKKDDPLVPDLMRVLGFKKEKTKLAYTYNTIYDL